VIKDKEKEKEMLNLAQLNKQKSLKKKGANKVAADSI
jgi:hypothetical protein